MIRRCAVTAPPFAEPPLLSRFPWDPPQQWPARWLAPPAGWELPLVMAVRLVLDLDRPLEARLHISADERYELWLDGARCGIGPERGDERRWSYESYEIALAPGRHVLCARVWSLGPLAPWAQCRLAPGFLCAAEGTAAERFDTGSAPWRLRRIAGFRFTNPSEAAGTGVGAGPAEEADLAADAWDPADAADGPQWVAGVPGEGGNNGHHILLSPRRLLVPAALPPQAEAPWNGMRAVAADAGEAGSPWADASPAPAWSALLAGAAPLTVPPRTRMRTLIDLGDYLCGRPGVVVDGGRGGRISLAIAEHLARRTPQGERRGHRDPVAGGRVRVQPDALLPDGGDGRSWHPLWWRAGRWLEVAIATGDEPLTLRRLAFTTTGYDFAVDGGARGTDPATAAVHAACLRTWRACAHETYMDCPHYEQLMYLGDTRVQALLTYALSADDRLPRKALDLFDSGRLAGRGLIPDAYPAGGGKVIQPFCLWWIGMLHDHAWWRGGGSQRIPPPAAGAPAAPEVVSAPGAARPRNAPPALPRAAFGCLRLHLPGARALMEQFLAEVAEDGLWPSSRTWNYLDWFDGFACGTPPGGEEGGRNCSFNWQLVHALGQWAELEDLAGEPELAARARRRRDRLASAIRHRFWDAGRRLFAEDPSHRHFAEHAQILALLSGILDPAERAGVAAGLAAPDGLMRTSCYFSHYLFEAYALLERTDLLVARLADWRACVDLGLRTTPEGFGGEVRSDCHAWSAHPLFHHLATLLGVRPAAPGFAAVRITPRPGPLAEVAGDVAHPLGTIRAAVRRTGDGLLAEIELPPGLPGELVWAGRSHRLRPGAQSLACPG